MTRHVGAGLRAHEAGIPQSLRQALVNDLPQSRGQVSMQPRCGRNQVPRRYQNPPNCLPRQYKVYTVIMSPSARCDTHTEERPHG